MAVIFFPYFAAGLAAVVGFAAVHLRDRVADEDQRGFAFADEGADGGVAHGPVVGGPVAVLGERDEGRGRRDHAGLGIEAGFGGFALLFAVGAEGAGLDEAAVGERDGREVGA